MDVPDYNTDRENKALPKSQSQENVHDCAEQEDSWRRSDTSLTPEEEEHSMRSTRSLQQVAFRISRRR